MKLHLPLGLRRAVYHTFIAMLATAATISGYTRAASEDVPETNDQALTEELAPGASDATPGTAENNWGLRNDKGSGNCWNVDGNVEWEGEVPTLTNIGMHNLNIGDYKGAATLTLLPDTTAGVYGSTFIGGTGYYGESASAMPEGYDWDKTPITPECNNEGTLNIMEGATFISASKQKDPTGAHLAIGWGRNSTGVVNVQGGKFIAYGSLYVNQHYNATGILNVTDGGEVVISGEGIQTYAGYSATFYVGLYGVKGDDKGGFVYLDGESSLVMQSTTSAWAYFCVGRGGAATDRDGQSYGVSRGEMTLTGKSTATFTDTLNYIGEQGKGIVNVKSGSSLVFDTAGIEGNQYTHAGIYLGVYDGGSGVINVEGVHKAEDGTITSSCLYVGDYAILGYNSGSSGAINVSSGATATIEGQAIIGYYTGTKGEVNVDGGTLTMGEAYVGNTDAEGKLSVKNGGKVHVAYMRANDTVDILGASTVEVDGNCVVDKGGVIKVDATSTLNIDGLLDVGYDGSGSLTVADGGVLDVGGDIYVSNGSSVTIPTLALKDGQTLSLDNNATISGSVSAGSGSTVDAWAATITGTLTLDGATLVLDTEQLATVGTLTTGSGTTTVDIGDITSLGLGTYTLLNYGSQAVDVANLTLANLPSASSSRASYQFRLSGSTLQLVIAGKAVDLLWNPEKATWSAGESGDEWNIVDAMGTSDFAHYDNVTFNAGDEVTIEGEVNPGRVTVSLAAGETLTLKGDGSIIGTGALSKDGGGTLVLNTANSYSGGTSITGDAFILDDSKTDFASASTVELGHVDALGSGGVTINGGVLDMNSLAVANDVTVNGQAVILDADKYEGQLTINAGGELTCAHMMDGGSHDNHDKGHITLNLAQNLLFNGGHIEESYTLTGTGGIVVDAGDGTARLDGTHEYTGDTLVQTGTLVLDGSVDGTDIVVSKGATLDLNEGTFANGSLKVESGGTLIGGTEDLNLSGNQTVTLGSTPTTEEEEPETTTLTGDTTAAGSSQIVVSSGAQVELAPEEVESGAGEGKLTLTDSASVKLEENAKLTLTSGTELNLGASEETNTNTKLVLAEGATVSVEQGAILNLSATGAQIDVAVDQNALDAQLGEKATYVVVSSAEGATNVISYADAQDAAAQVTVENLAEYRDPVVNATTEQISVTVGSADLVWNNNTNTDTNKGVWKAGEDSAKHWDYITTDVTTDGGEDKFYQRDRVGFINEMDDQNTALEVDIEGTVKPGGVVVEQSNDLVLGTEGSTDGSIGGSGSIDVYGGGTVTLNTTNSYSGGTNVSNGSTVKLGAEGALGEGNVVLYGEDYVDEESTRTVLDANSTTVENEVILLGATELVNASGLQNITVMGGSDTLVEEDLVLGEDVALTVDGAAPFSAVTFALAIDEPAPVQTGTTSTFRGNGVTLDGLTLSFANQGRLGYTGACTLTENWAALIDLSEWGEVLSKTDEIGLIQFTDEAATPLTGSEYVDSGVTKIDLENDVLEQYAHLRYDDDGWVVLYFTAPAINEQLASRLSRNQSHAYSTLIAIAEDNMEELATDPLSIAAARAANAETADELKELLDSVSGEEYATMMASQIEGNLAHLRRLRGHMGHGHLLGNSKSGLAAFANAYSDTAEVDADASGLGYKRNEWGAQVGVEQEIAENMGIGLALSVGRANVTPTGGVRYHEDNQHLDAYHFMRRGAWENRVSVGVGLHEHDLARRGYTSTMASAGNVDGTSFNFMEEISYRLPVTESLTLRPFFAVESSVNHIDGFAEGGNSTLALHGDAQDAWATDLTLGVSAETRFAVLERAPRATAELHAGITASVGDTTSDLRMHFAGAPGHSFEQSSADRNRWGMNLGAGVNIPVTRFTSVYANAEAVLRGDSSSFDAQLGVHINF